MIFHPTFINDLYVIELELFKDQRGWFARTFCKEEFKKIGHHKEWVQMNHSFTNQMGAMRGMHFQLPPYTETKLVRCISGSVYDVALDLRKDSPTFLKWFGTEISAENKKMILIPDGFAHGFQALTNNCELIYHHTNFYTPEAEGGIRYNDPLIGIKWPLEVSDISEKDSKYVFLKEDFKGI
jgi:dTDP-4-dehydrorhamnose 3,5-epimerase